MQPEPASAEALQPEAAPAEAEAELEIIDMPPTPQVPLPSTSCEEASSDQECEAPIAIVALRTAEDLVLDPAWEFSATRTYHVPTVICFAHWGWLMPISTCVPPLMLPLTEPTRPVSPAVAPAAMHGPPQSIGGALRLVDGRAAAAHPHSS